MFRKLVLPIGAYQTFVVTPAQDTDAFAPQWQPPVYVVDISSAMAVPFETTRTRLIMGVEELRLTSTLFTMLKLGGEDPRLTSRLEHEFGDRDYFSIQP